MDPPSMGLEEINTLEELLPTNNLVTNVPAKMTHMDRKEEEVNNILY